MRKSFTVLSGIFLVSLTIWLTTTCRKEEFVVVYSKVTTVRAFNATSTTITVEGSIDSLTSAAHDEFGFSMDTLADPTVYKQKILAAGTVELGTFGGTISGLKPAKTYHIRAFIKDNNKYLYGKDVSFSTTAAILPTLTTSSASEIKATTAISGGNVTSEGDRPVLAKGICYDTVATPTILKNKTMDGWGTGSFTSKLMDLLPNKTYYMRAYAVSEFGVGYGSQQSFTTKNALYSFHENFNDNTNEWYEGNSATDTARLIGGIYELAFKQSGYIWRVYSGFPDFEVIENKDWEIKTCINISSYGGFVSFGVSMVGGLTWNSDDSHFNFFLVKKVQTLDRYSLGIANSYSYQVGKYDGSYTILQDYTTFSGSDSLRLSIKKANDKYYFFINNNQVYSSTYSSVSYDGVGFIVADSRIKADYLYIDQKDFKKASPHEFIEMKSLPGGHSIIRSFLKK
ncbi:MAG: hypothetical protein IPN68_15120 [Bacteroidetes bacterium]|nr:hypothetical protein [Bacteroidota bacterium]